MRKSNPIFVWFVNGGGKKPNDITIYAIAEDGDLLVKHVSSDKKFFLQDAGVTSTAGHHKYSLKFPDGDFTVIPVENPETEQSILFKKAYAAYKQRS